MPVTMRLRAHPRVCASACWPAPRPVLKRLPDVSMWCAGALGAAVLLCSADAASAAQAVKVGEFTSSGLVFKDTIEVASLEDPDVEGATIYLTDYKRSITERLSKDLFGDPAQGSVTCAATGPLRIKDVSKLRSKDGVEVFEELKSLNLLQNKRLRVRRLYDEAHNTLVYVAFNTRFNSSQDEASSSRYRTSLCVLPLSADAGGTAASTPAAAER